MAEREGIEILKRLQGEPPSEQEVKGWIGQPPQLVLVDLAKNCNLWCDLHCGYPGQQLRREEKINGGVAVEPPYIDVDTLKRAYDEIMTSWQPFRPAIQISADGEPLLHPRREEAICYPASHGLKVGLTTNGTLLKPELVAKFCDAGVNLINVSLDAATEQTYGVVRPTRNKKVNFFDTVVSNIVRAVEVRNNLAQTRDVPTQIMITMIVREETRDEEEAFIELGRKMGVDKVSYRPLNTTAGLTPFEGGNIHLIQIDENGVVQEVDRVKRHPCHFPFTRFSLTVAGEGSVKFVYCPHAWDRTEADIGVFPRDGSLKDLWKSTKLEEIRSYHLTGQFPSDSLCGPCADWRLVTGRDQVTFAKVIKSTSEN